MTVEFTKMHADGNDFVLIEETEVDEIEDRAVFAEKYCDRNKGIGANGVVYLSHEGDSDVSMRLYQPDGSEADMCGNALRCIARLIHQDTGNESIQVETRAGLKQTWIEENGIRLNLGEPLFEPSNVPSTETIDEADIHGYKVTAVNTGVPHAVVFTEDLAEIDIEKEAPPIRYSDVFPEGANVDFAEIQGDEGAVIDIRTYERGVEDVTPSCGSGAAAVYAVALKKGFVTGSAEIRTPGGALTVSMTDDEIHLVGGAEEVYRGSLNPR